VRKITFTGSTSTGRLLMSQAAPGLKRLSMELGGNAPFIVFEDADLDLAVRAALAAKYRNAGQTCVCVNRFLVHTAVYDAFAERLAAASKDLVVGPGGIEGVHVGPLINAAAVAKVEAHVADAVGRGAQVIAGGGRHALGGTFFAPTVLTGVTRDMRPAREETFGPLAILMRFETEDEAVRIANDSEYGLAAYVCTQDLSRAMRVSEALDYGMVGVNTGLISSEVAPFGGVKASGFGREGSVHGLADYTALKYVCIEGL
jgi:succinate-semialdehyde dehydrogenase/glutarate-semialdehyde dehydrogenase